MQVRGSKMLGCHTDLNTVCRCYTRGWGSHKSHDDPPWLCNLGQMSPESKTSINGPHEKDLFLRNFFLKKKHPWWMPGSIGSSSLLYITSFLGCAPVSQSHQCHSMLGFSCYGHIRSCKERCFWNIGSHVFAYPAKVLFVCVHWKDAIDRKS